MTSLPSAPCFLGRCALWIQTCVVAFYLTWFDILNACSTWWAALQHYLQAIGKVCYYDVMIKVPLSSCYVFVLFLFFIFLSSFAFCARFRFVSVYFVGFLSVFLFVFVSKSNVIMTVNCCDVLSPRTAKKGMASTVFLILGDPEPVKRAKRGKRFNENDNASAFKSGQAYLTTFVAIVYPAFTSSHPE